MLVDLRNGGAMAFDLEKDPAETENILETHAADLAPLMKFYNEWLDAPGAR